MNGLRDKGHHVYANETTTRREGREDNKHEKSKLLKLSRRMNFTKWKMKRTTVSLRTLAVLLLLINLTVATFVLPNILISPRNRTLRENDLQDDLNLLSSRLTTRKSSASSHAFADVQPLPVLSSDDDGLVSKSSIIPKSPPLSRTDAGVENHFDPSDGWILSSSRRLPDYNANNEDNIKKVHLSTRDVPIYIDGNADFANQAASWGWPGNGSAADPYRIENLMIVTNLNDTNAIDIRNTDVYFIIRNCTVTASYGSGIYLRNVTNALLVNNTASYNRAGFYLWYSNNNTVTNNTASTNWYGFYLAYSDNNMMDNNIAINNTMEGFVLAVSRNNIVINNDASHNYWAGFLVESSSSKNALVNNTASTNQYKGFYLAYSDNNMMDNNIAINNEESGFFLEYSNNNTLVNNNVSHNLYGFFLKTSVNNTVINNTMADNGLFLDGNDVSSMIQTRVEGNTVNGKSVLFWQHQFNKTIDGTVQEAGQLILLNCSFIQVRSLTIANASVGYQVLFSHHVTLVNNTASYNQESGFLLQYSNNNTVINNTASHNLHGFYLWVSSSNNTVANNTAINNQHGFFLSYSNNNTVINNTASHNLRGFFLSYSNNNTVANNTATNNQHGFFLNNSNNNTLINNNAAYNNKSGFYVSEYSNNNMLLSNVACYNMQDGFSLFFITSIDNVLINNTAINNTGNGFQLSGSHVLINNVASYNGGNGFYLGSDSNVLIDNTASYNRENGFLLQYSNNNTLINNVATGNHKTGFSLSFLTSENTLKMNGAFTNMQDGFRIVSSSSNNLLEENKAWDNAGLNLFISTDSSGNILRANLIAPSFTRMPPDLVFERDTTGHIISWIAVDYENENGSFAVYHNDTILITGNWTSDVPISISVDDFQVGNHNVTIVIRDADNLTLTDIVWVSVDFLSVPTVIHPNGGEMVDDLVIITWQASIDSLGHSMTYSVYYITDRDSWWTLLATGLTNTSRAWNTTGIPDGTTCMIKVVATDSNGLTSEDISDDTFTIQHSRTSWNSTSASTSFTTTTSTSEINMSTKSTTIVVNTPSFMITSWLMVLLALIIHEIGTRKLPSRR